MNTILHKRIVCLFVCCLKPLIALTGQTCVDIKDQVVNEGYYFTPKGDDPCLSCTCHDGEPEMCVAALCERPQGCLHFRKDPKECCKFTCLDPGTDEPLTPLVFSCASIPITRTMDVWKCPTGWSSLLLCFTYQRSRVVAEMLKNQTRFTHQSLLTFDLPLSLADGSSLFDSMASGMRLIVSCISSFLILSLLLFMVHRLRQRRRERIETLIGGNRKHAVHHIRHAFKQQMPP